VFVRKDLEVTKDLRGLKRTSNLNLKKCNKKSSVMRVLLGAVSIFDPAICFGIFLPLPAGISAMTLRNSGAIFYIR